MRTRGAKYLAILAGSAAFGGLSLLTQCGGSSGGTGSPTEPDSEAPDAAAEGGEPGIDSGGSDATLDAGMGDATVGVVDAGTDADAALVEASADSGPGVDANLDAGPTLDADSSMDAGDGSDGAFVDAGPPLIPCDVDAQADAQTCVGPATEACCGGFCADTARDPRNCGQCGVVCTTHQFCTGLQCDDAIVANVCGNLGATVVFDQYAADNEGGASIGAALAASCGTNVVQLAEDAGGVTDPTTGRPITGPGNTFVTGGGGFGHVGIAYLDSMNLTPLYPFVTGDEYDVIQRSTGAKVVSTTFEALTPQHDFFYIELAVEPESGTLSVSGVGMLAYGTVAAGYYIGAQIIPNRASYTKAWYLFEWTDTTNDMIPDLGDTFTQVAMGN
jgi:hypothetical protein